MGLEHGGRRILVTGANRGIGLAIVRRCLSNHIDTHVVLACRRALAGGEAAASLIADRPDWKARLTVLEMDTSSDSSVIAAAAKLEADFGRTLYAIVRTPESLQALGLASLLLELLLGLAS